MNLFTTVGIVADVCEIIGDQLAYPIAILSAQDFAEGVATKVVERASNNGYS